MSLICFASHQKDFSLSNLGSSSLPLIDFYAIYAVLLVGFFCEASFLLQVKVHDNIDTTDCYAFHIFSL
jgi:hypothetical protein